MNPDDLQRFSYRQIRRVDVPSICAVHGEMFPYLEEDVEGVLYSAIDTNRWFCPVAIDSWLEQASVAGFAIAAVGAVQEFSQVDGDLLLQGSTAWLGQLSPDTRIMYLCLLGVMPEYRRRGLATRLLDYTMQYGRYVGAQAIYLHTMSGDEGTRVFYSGQGFHRIAQIQNMYRLPPRDGSGDAPQPRDADVYAAWMGESRPPLQKVDCLEQEASTAHVQRVAYWSTTVCLAVAGGCPPKPRALPTRPWRDIAARQPVPIACSPSKRHVGNYWNGPPSTRHMPPAASWWNNTRRCCVRVR